MTSDIETGHFERGSGWLGASSTSTLAPNKSRFRSCACIGPAARTPRRREQYGHYAAVMRDQLGIDPPALEAL